MKIIYKLAMLLGAVGLMVVGLCGSARTVEVNADDVIFTVNGVSFKMVHVAGAPLRWGRRWSRLAMPMMMRSLRMR